MTRDLVLTGVSSGYGQVTVLASLNLEVRQGETVAVIGANGAGKTTLLRTIAGLVRCSRGTVRFGDIELNRIAAHDVVARGIAMVAEGGRLFPFMTVQENLELGAFHPAARSRSRVTMAEMFELFPILAERRGQLAGSLSGGERQMCAVARALMSKPQLLMLDEPSLGLSPLMVEELFGMVRRIGERRECSVLLVEQNVQDALELAERAYVLERGAIVKNGPGRALLSDPEVRQAYLGV